MDPKIIVTDRDDGDNARIKVICSTKEKGSDSEACATFRVETDMVNNKNIVLYKLYIFYYICVAKH